MLPEEREAVLQRLREWMVLRLSQNPRAWVVFVLRNADLTERELPRTVELARARERLALHPAFPTSRWQMEETANGKRYLRVGDWGRRDEQRKRPRKSTKISEAAPGGAFSPK